MGEWQVGEWQVGGWKVGELQVEGQVEEWQVGEWQFTLSSPPPFLSPPLTYLCQLLHGPLVYPVPAHRDSAHCHSCSTPGHGVLCRSPLGGGTGRSLRGSPLGS